MPISVPKLALAVLGVLLLAGCAGDPSAAGPGAGPGATASATATGSTPSSTMGSATAKKRPPAAQAAAKTATRAGADSAIPIAKVTGKGRLVAPLAAASTAPPNPGPAPGPVAAPTAPAPLAEDLEQGRQALAEGRIQAAHRHFAAALARAPADPQAMLGLSDVYLQAGQPDRALEGFQRVRTGPNDVIAQARQGQGLALLRLGRDAEACPRLKAAVTADAALWRAWNGLGTCDDILGRWQDAKAAYGKALALKPGSALLLNNLGYSLLLQRHYVQAEAEFRKALEAQPNLEVARANLRLALAWQGRYDEALAGTAASQMPNALNDVGYIAALRGDVDKAVHYLTQAMTVSPTWQETAARNLQYVRMMRKGFN